MALHIKELEIDSLANMLYMCKETPETQGLILLDHSREVSNFADAIVDRQITEGIDGVDRILQDMQNQSCQIFFSNESWILITCREDHIFGKKFHSVLYSGEISNEKRDHLNRHLNYHTTSRAAIIEDALEKKRLNYGKSKELDEFLGQFKVI